MAGHSYVFSLYRGATLLAQVSVTRAAPTPTPTTAWIDASPNPVPAGAGAGTATISWSTADGSIGQVWVVVDDALELLFAQSPAGSADAGWINAGHTYAFGLRAGVSHGTLLDEVVVTRGS